MIDSLHQILSELLEGEEICDNHHHPDYKQAAHCAIYSFSDKKVLSKYPAKANVFMQMRFDGKLGFPGGLIKNNEDIIDGLNREMEEEINFNTDKFKISKENHIISLVNHQTKHYYHFYCLFVSPDEFYDVEKQVVYAKDYGNETFGLLRVPLHTFKGDLGFPSFLHNNFIGKAKYQLLYFLGKNQILSIEELTNVVKYLKN